MADGGKPSRIDRLTQRVAPYVLGTALSLNATQQQDQRNYNPDDAGLSDQSVGQGGSEDTRQSVLSAGAAEQSYTSDQTEQFEGPSVGGGLMQTPGMEYQRVRQREEQMRRTQEQLVGEPAEGGAAPRRGPAAGPRRQEPKADERAQGESGEFDMAQDLQEQQTGSREEARKVLQQAREEGRRRLQQALQGGPQETIKGIRNVEEGAQIILSPSVIAIVALVVEWNIQLIYTYVAPVFEGRDENLDALLKIKTAKAVGILGVDSLLTCGGICFNPCCQMTFIIIVIVTIAVVIAKKIGMFIPAGASLPL